MKELRYLLFLDTNVNFMFFLQCEHITLAEIKNFQEHFVK